MSNESANIFLMPWKMASLTWMQLGLPNLVASIDRTSNLVRYLSHTSMVSISVAVQTDWLERLAGSPMRENSRSAVAKYFIFYFELEPFSGLLVPGLKASAFTSWGSPYFPCFLFSADVSRICHCLWRAGKDLRRVMKLVHWFIEWEVCCVAK